MDLLLLWAVFVLSQLLPFSAQENISHSVATCPENFQCGNRSFMFPFSNWSSYNCGLCVVDCENKSFPRIALKYPAEQWFGAKSIENSTMTLIDPRLQHDLENQSCQVFHHAILLPNSPSISFMILKNVTLFRCLGYSTANKKLNDSFRGYGYYGGCDNFTLYYKYPNSLSPTPSGGIDPSCSPLYLPMNKIFFPDNKSDVPEVFRLLAAEFDLQWHVSEQCQECHHGGGICPTEWSTGPHCVDDESETRLGIGQTSRELVY